MSLPVQVRKQMEEVEAMERELRGATPAVQDEPPAEIKPAEPAAVVPDKAVTPEQPATPEVPEAKKPEEEPWQQRYMTLKGMFDSQVPTLHRQNKELQSSIQQLQDEMTKLKSAPAPEAKPESLVTDKDEEEFGKDLIELQRRVVREMVTPLQTEMDTLKKENDSLRAQLGQTGTKVAEMSFEQRLATKVPDFDAVNADPRWVTWLDEHDPILRGPRRIAAQSAFERGDVGAVSDYVTLWRSGIATPAAPVADPKTDELQAQVAPVRSAASAAPQDKPGDKVYTADEADAAWTKITVLNRGGKYEEANKLETDLTAAYNTGRVR